MERRALARPFEILSIVILSEAKDLLSYHPHLKRTRTNTVSPVRSHEILASGFRGAQIDSNHRLIYTCA